MKTKDQGIDQVIENHQIEAASLRTFAESWIKNRKGEFTFEDIKTDYLKLNPPVTRNLNGGLMSRIAESGLIAYVRHTQAKLPEARKRQISVWKRRVIQNVQPNNQIPMFI